MVDSEGAAISTVKLKQKGKGITLRYKATEASCCAYSVFDSCSVAGLRAESYRTTRLSSDERTTCFKNRQRQCQNVKSTIPGKYGMIITKIERRHCCQPLISLSFSTMVISTACCLQGPQKLGRNRLGGATCTSAEVHKHEP